MKDWIEVGELDGAANHHREHMGYEGLAQLPDPERWRRKWCCGFRIQRFQVDDNVLKFVVAACIRRWRGRRFVTGIEPETHALRREISRDRHPAFDHAARFEIRGHSISHGKFEHENAQQ